MFFLDFIRPMWRHSKHQTVLFFALSFISGLTEGIGLFLLVPIMGSLQGQSNPDGFGATVLNWISAQGVPTSLPVLLAIFLVLVLMRSVIQYIHATVTARMQLDLINALRTTSFHAVLSSNWRWASTLVRSDQSNALTNEMQRIASGLTTAFSMPMLFFLIIAYLIAAISLSFKLALIALAVGGILLLALRSQHVQAFQLGKSLTGAQRAMQKTIQEGFASIKATKILGNELRHTQKLEQTLDTVRDQQLAFVKTNSRAAAIFQFIIALFLGGVILVGHNVFAIGFSELVVFALILIRLAPMLRKVQQSINQLLHAWPALTAYEELQSNALKNADSAHQPNATVKGGAKLGH